MTSRERVRLALNHKQPDKVPLDLGSTSCTGIAAGALNKLRKALKLKEKKIVIHEPFQMLGNVELDVLKAIGADFIGIWSPYTMYGFKNENFKQWTTQYGLDVLVPEGFQTTIDKNDTTFIYPCGDKTVLPSGRMPKGGLYFDSINRGKSFDDLDFSTPKEDYKNDFTIIKDEDLKTMQKNADFYYNNTDLSLVGNGICGALGDSAFIPGIGLKQVFGIRKYEEWLMAHFLEPNYIKDVYEYQTETAITNLSLYKEAFGDKLDVIWISGSDFGSQRCELISVDIYKEFYKPFYKRMNDWVHKNTTWKTFYHSCGSIVNLLDDMVDAGVDILNPVQCSATGMDPKMLKEKYGDKLTFWGGGVNTQETLPFGTPEEVRKETLNRLEIFSKNGGYICNTIHNIQNPTTTENMMAFFNAVKEFNHRKYM